VLGRSTHRARCCEVGLLACAKLPILKTSSWFEYDDAVSGAVVPDLTESRPMITPSRVLVLAALAACSLVTGVSCLDSMDHPEAGQYCLFADSSLGEAPLEVSSPLVLYYARPGCGEAECTVDVSGTDISASLSRLVPEGGGGPGCANAVTRWYCDVPPLAAGRYQLLVGDARVATFDVPSESPICVSSD
jgi:hypothetical protein